MECSFCGKKAVRHLALCPRCMAEITSLAPDDPRYLWFARAVGRSLKGAFLDCVLAGKDIQ